LVCWRRVENENETENEIENEIEIEIETGPFGVVFYF